MPGICAIFGDFPSDDRRNAVSRMAELMVHEPHHSHCWRDYPGNSTSIGWASDLEAPALFHDTDEGVTILITGNLLANALAHYVNPENVCRELVKYYVKEGIQSFLRLNGSFSGILIDHRTRTSLVFNDRYGSNRLYCYRRAGQLFIASEAKCILRVAPETTRLCERGLGEMFILGCTLQDRTLFSNLSLLPPASALSFEHTGDVISRRYFHPSTWEHTPQLQLTDFLVRLKKVLSTSVPRYTQRITKNGLSLTGGIDSRIVLALSRMLPGELPCYTFSGMYRESVDVRIARRLSYEAKQQHHTIKVGQEFLQTFPSLVAHCVYVSDGIMDPTGAAEIYTNRLARRIAPIRLTGNYGGEILRRLVAFKPMRLMEQVFEPDFVPYLRMAERTYHEEKRCHPLTFVAFKQVPWHHACRLAVEKSQIEMRSPYLDNDVVELSYAAPPEFYLSKRPSLRLIAEINPAFAAIPTDRGLSEPATNMSSLLSLFQQLSFKAEYACDYGLPNWVCPIERKLRFMKTDHFFLGRHKFNHYRVWYRDQLAQFVRETLLDGHVLHNGIFSDSAVERVVFEHTHGLANHTLLLHKLITYALTTKLLTR